MATASNNTFLMTWYACLPEKQKKLPTKQRNPTFSFWRNELHFFQNLILNMQIGYQRLLKMRCRLIVGDNFYITYFCVRRNEI
jgi:hypothetical protein